MSSGMENPKTPFVEEIDFSEIELLEVVGQGSFGVVSKGKWRGKFVAVKKIEGKSEKRAFIVERQQLSRVNHPNIVKLYGACTKSPVCLVMEYAEGGSLHNVLHLSPHANYTISHAMSWALQCAKGVSYLHDMKPKALIHRDLKPPNLLLIMGGTVLKICDFGTACDIQTQMTNNKGSAAWMAPEVFEGHRYSEKCDVFSWGIILWEVFTRHKPFSELNGNEFSIMWAVHTGTRPPLIQGCPLDIEKLMTCCWDKMPQRRPSMSEVVDQMTEFFKCCKGVNEPISFSPSDDENSSVYQSEEFVTEEEEIYSQAPSLESVSVQSPQQSPTEQQSVPLPNLKWVGQLNQLKEPISVEVNEKFTPTVVELSVVSPDKPLSQTDTSLSPSLASSPENIHVTINKNNSWKRRSADLTSPTKNGLKLNPITDFHTDEKKYGSYGSLNTNPKSCQLDNFPTKYQIPKFECQSQPTVYAPSSPTKPGFTSSSYRSSLNGSAQNYNNLGFYNVMLEPQFQLLSPIPNEAESMKVFEKHIEIAQEYVRVQVETNFLLKRRDELTEELAKNQTITSEKYTDGDKYINDVLELQNEKQSLQTLYANLKRQLEILKNQPKPINSDDWAMLQ